MQIVPLNKGHLDSIRIQDRHVYISGWMDDATKSELVRGSSFAAIDGEKVLGCAGVLEYWEGRAAAWAFLSGDCGRHFVGIHRAVLSFLDLNKYRRLEATADVGFNAANKWLQMLGFTLETPEMKNYMPNGAAAAMYVRGS